MLRALQKRLREERRHGITTPIIAEPLARVESLPATLESHDTPLDCGALSDALAEKLAAVEALHPRLHESLSQLDPAQLAAVFCEDAAALVRAPVGSGKTTVLVHKVLYLHYVKGVPLRRMALLTFTNRAAQEFRTRIEQLASSPISSNDFWLTGTFHGVARTLLASALPVEKIGFRRDFSVLDEDALALLLESVVSRHRLRVGRRSTLRKRLRALDSSSETSGDLKRLGELLFAEKQAQNAMDFDDLIDHASALLATRDALSNGFDALPPSHILVDEMQDCEPRELTFLQRLRGSATHFFGVGDPHQAIYGFRGSAPQVFSKAEQEFGCKLYALPVNYRSTRTIVDGARAVLGMQAAAGGALRTVREAGARIVIQRHHDPLSESLYLAERISQLHAQGLRFSELAILYRLRAQSEPIRAALVARGIPCAESDELRPELDSVCLLTLHAGKGLEFRHIFLSGINAGLVPLGLGFDTAADAEEQRLLFVGLTRARDGVEISYHTRPQELGALGEPSPFLLRLPAALVDWQDAPALTSSSAEKEIPAEPAPPPEAAPKPSETSWHPGQSVRHPRYGAGVVTGVSGDMIDCTFGKFGPRSFPLALCPLTTG